jgi:hypothetical protein
MISSRFHPPLLLITYVTKINLPVFVRYASGTFNVVGNQWKLTERRAKLQVLLSQYRYSTTNNVSFSGNVLPSTAITS